MLEKGVNINLCCDDYFIVFYVVCCNKCESIVEILLNNGVVVNFLCFLDYVSFFYLVCKNGYESIVKFLFDNGVDRNLKIINGLFFFVIVY